MIALIIIASLFAEAVGTVAGFGSSTLLLPLVLLGYDFRSALVLVAIFHVSGAIMRLIVFRRGIDKRLIVRFGIPSVVFTIAGAGLVSYIPQETLKGILGIFLAGYSFLLLVNPKLHETLTIRNELIGGGISGFFAGLIGTGGALRTAFLSAFPLRKTTFLATSAFIAVAVDLSRLPVYLSQGYLKLENLEIIPFLIVASVFGTIIGERIVRRIPQKRFRTVILAAVLLAGVLFIREWLMA